MSSDQKDTHEELKKWLVRRLGMDNVPAPLWQLLLEDHWVDDALNPDFPDGKEELLKRARQLLRFSREMGSSGPDDGRGFAETATRGQHRHVPRFLPGDPVYERADAISLYLAKVADNNRAVRQFRLKILDGGTVSPAQAEALVCSPAAAILPHSWFKGHDVPLLDHTAGILEGENAGVEGTRAGQSTLEIRWADGELLVPFERENRSRTLASLLRIYDRERFWGNGGWSTARTEVYEGSVLGNLSEIAGNLKERLPWSLAEAEWFILTGEQVQIAPLYHSEPDESDLGAVTLTVAPWVPAETVDGLYKAVREMLNPASMPSPRRLALFRFVAAHPEVKVSADEQTPEVPSWRRLMGSWNEGYPAGNEWHYKDARNFRRDSLKAFEQLIVPPEPTLPKKITVQRQR